jgi:hypothetical protein
VVSGKSGKPLVKLVVCRAIYAHYTLKNVDCKIGSFPDVLVCQSRMGAGATGSSQIWWKEGYQSKRRTTKGQGL